MPRKKKAPELTFQQHVADYLVCKHKYGVLEQSDITDTEHFIAEDLLWTFLKATQGDTLKNLEDERRAYEIKRRMGITPQQMAEACIRLAVAPEFENVSGKFFDENCSEAKAYKSGYDRAVWHRLRQVSESLTGLAQ